MANKFGVNYTAQDPVGAGDTTGAVPAAVDVAEWGGRVRVCYDSFTASGATGTSDVLYVGKIPANATVLYGILEHDNSNSSATYKVDVGATTMRAAATATISIPHLFGVVTAGTKTTALTDVTVTLGTAALADTKTVKCMIYYTVD
tara:strand:+ start:2536 stop:2973 length:438 start_codon:yes stop_codon:yes gene_type:complete